LKNEFVDILVNEPTKNIDFVQSGLRSATNIMKYGGHVLSKYSDKKYSLDYDNKRRIID